MKKRIEIEVADNGYMITVYGNKKKSKDSDMDYYEPEKLVARDEEEVLEVVKENLS